MLQIRKLIISIMYTLLCFGSTHAAIINVALDGTATASNSWLTNTPDLAIDGDVFTGWNSGDWPVEWIEIDLGAQYQIETITGLVGQLPDAHTNHDVYLDGILSFSWTGFTADNDLLSETFLSPVSAQFITINTTVSPSWVAWKEIEVWADVPEPGTLILMSIGLIGISCTRRKHK